jgi:hypothetical protein
MGEAGYFFANFVSENDVTFDILFVFRVCEADSLNE